MREVDKTDSSKEYQEGWDAYLGGMSADSCPYKTTLAALQYAGNCTTEWIKGYCDAERWCTS